MARSAPIHLSKVAIAIVIVLLVLVAGVVVAFLASMGPSVRPSIQIGSVTVDRVDTLANSSIYILGLNASNSGTAAWEFNPAFLQLVSNSSQAYGVDRSYNMTAPVSSFSLGQGKNLVAQLAFQLPDNQAPSSLRYSDTGRGIDLTVGNVPAASSFVSRFGYNVALTVNGGTVNGWTVTPVNGSEPWLHSLIANGVIMNNSRVFMTGQTVQVNLWFEYLRKPADPMAITFRSVSAASGFQILSADPEGPFIMSGWGAQAGIVLLLKIPPGQQASSLSLALVFST